MGERRPTCPPIRQSWHPPPRCCPSSPPQCHTTLSKTTIPIKRYPRNRTRTRNLTPVKKETTVDGCRICTFGKFTPCPLSVDVGQRQAATAVSGGTFIRQSTTTCCASNARRALPFSTAPPFHDVCLPIHPRSLAPGFTDSVDPGYESRLILCSVHLKAWMHGRHKDIEM